MNFNSCNNISLCQFLENQSIVFVLFKIPVLFYKNMQIKRYFEEYKINTSLKIKQKKRKTTDE